MRDHHHYHTTDHQEDCGWDAAADCMSSALLCNCCQCASCVGGSWSEQGVHTKDNAASSAPCRWMEYLGDQYPDIKFRDLLLVGSHDAASSSIPNGQPCSAVAQCQSMSMTQQLQAGIRVFDIRVATLMTRNATSASNIGIWHGRVPGGEMVTTVLQPLVTFVQQYPHETIILQVTPEFGRPFSVSAKEHTLALVHHYLGEDLILHARHLPNLLQSTTLGDLRQEQGQRKYGRILVLVHQRFFCKPDSHHFNATSVLQDYGFGLLDKWVRSLWYNTRHADTLLTYATAEVERHGRDTTRHFHVSQLVLTPGIAGWGDVLAACMGQNSLQPISLAYRLNQRLGTFLCRNVHLPWNIILLDYVDMGWPIVHLWTALNFPIPIRIHWATWETTLVPPQTTDSATMTTTHDKPRDVTAPLTTACLCRNRVLYVDNVEQFLPSDEIMTAMRCGGILTIVYQVGEEHQVVKQSVAPAKVASPRRPIVVLSGWGHVCDQNAVTKLPPGQHTYQGRPIPRQDPPTNFRSQSAGSLPYFSSAVFVLLGAVAVVYSLVLHLWVHMLCNKPPIVTPLPEPTPAMQRRVAIVTGSNTGIGYETARRLAVGYGMTVVLACRSRDKGEQAVIEIQRQGGKGAVFLHPLDLSSSQAIQEFCQAIKEKFNSIHILVNNAGRNSSSPDPVEGNRDLLFQTNFLGHFELTAQLMDVFAPKARVVNLSSVMHHFVEGDVNDSGFWEGCISHTQSPLSTYQPSKLAALLFSIQLNQRFGDRIESVAVNPGGVNSDIWRNFPRFIIPIFAMVYLNSQEGSQTSVAGALCGFADLQLGHGSPVAYLQPYAQFFGRDSLSQPVFPLFEMLGIFGGHSKVIPRLPTNDDGLRASQALWQACTEVTNSIWPQQM